LHQWKDRPLCRRPSVARFHTLQVGRSPVVNLYGGSRCQAPIFNNGIFSSFPSYPFVRPAVEPSFRPDLAGLSHARRAQGRSRMAIGQIVHHAHIISRPFLDGPRARRQGPGASGPTDQWRSPTSGQIRALIPAQPQAQSAETSKATLARAANAPAAPAPLSIGQKVAVVTIANSASCKSFDDIRPEGDIDCLWA
jgi:hypothetical protein